MSNDRIFGCGEIYFYGNLFCCDGTKSVILYNSSELTKKGEIRVSEMGSRFQRKKWRKPYKPETECTIYIATQKLSRTVVQT
jgi:hypothetical protein